MKYNYQLSRLREELATLKRDTTTCALELHDLDHWTGDYRSYAGSDFASHVVLPREAATVEEWLQSLGKGGVH